MFEIYKKNQTSDPEAIPQIFDRILACYFAPQRHMWVETNSDAHIQI